MERVISSVEARNSFSQILTEAAYANRPAIIERNNQPIAVVIGYEQYQGFLELWQKYREREGRFAIYDEIRARNVNVTPEEVAADVAEAVRAIRASKQ